jgi:hypothetical protein
MDLDSVVSIATSYKPDGPGIESWWKQIFHTSPQAHPNGNKVSLPGAKQLGHGSDHPPPSNVEVKEREQL